MINTIVISKKICMENKYKALKHYLFYRNHYNIWYGIHLLWGLEGCLRIVANNDLIAWDDFIDCSKFVMYLKERLKRREDG